MQDLVFGIVAVIVGGLLCRWGFVAMRVMIPVWGAFTGFVVGAGIVDSVTDARFLGSVAAWIVGLAVAAVFGLLAYLYYEVSVLLAMSAIGFALGTSAMVALGVRWSWLIVLVGALAGTALALVAIVADLPTLILIVLTALAGASTVVLGVALLTGEIDAVDLDVASTSQRLDEGWWYLIYVVVAIAGMLAQLSGAERLRSSVREQWAESGGRQFRSHHDLQVR